MKMFMLGVLASLLATLTIFWLAPIVVLLILSFTGAI